MRAGAFAGRRRVGGAFLVLLGLCFTAWVWRTALAEGRFHFKAAMVMPAFAVIGAALLVFPGYREERVARGEDISGLRGWALITTRWKIVLGAALLAGILNLAALALAG